VGFNYVTGYAIRKVYENQEGIEYNYLHKYFSDGGNLLGEYMRDAAFFR
jgi:hypothetical protein